MRYFFVRHGIAEELVDSDFARELTERGRRRVSNASAVIRDLGIRPARIYTSPRLRALQTAEIIAETLGMEATVSEALNFGFDLSDVQSLSGDMRADDEIMFVGHNPDMSLLVHKLTGSNVAMKKCGLARIDVFGRKARQGELVWLIAPKVFDSLYQRSAEFAVATANGANALPDKLAVTDSPLHQLIKRRWSPVGFDPDRNIDKATLLSILEAARWAASSSNLQPWRFIVASKDNPGEFKKMLSGWPG